ncbi:unnamed protein product [Kuraishia capsulata CBS 1993]|uniref:Phosphatidylserine decarboxylase proenzyme 2 n=1 Tax=Kuraishia capsulata CBS 1993 TaxID=1382522 RepID=W6MUT3_9ASCO|nr:uncharacterized protein KUCA_T00005509001 [Kuraishia capsulata CBS 1993]CDK29517.1 unnamed protein product [Kuraishia capsulata CBS 1993]
MKTIKKRSKEEHLLEVTVIRSEGLLLDQNLGTKCNPICVLSIPEISSGKTSKIKGSSSPQWNETVSLRLAKGRESGFAFCATIWDKHRIKREYLGELRLPLDEVLNMAMAQESEKTFKLYSSRSRQKYVTGTLVLKFSLSKNGTKVSSLENTPDGLVASPSKISEQTVCDLVRNVSETDRKAMEQIIQVDEQGFYPEDWRFSIPDSDVPQEQENVEPSSLLSPNDRPSKFMNSLSSPSMAPSSTASSITPRLSKKGHSKLSSHAYSTADFSSDFSEFDLTDTDTSNMWPVPSKKADKADKASKASRAYKLSSRNDISGILVLEITTASDLPPYNSLTRTGFDMDPFVVISFGKRVYRTSWRKHTLNPQFNEKLAIEISNLETGYELQFSVLDKDHFTFNDQVATGSLKIAGLMKEDNQYPEELSLELKLDGTKRYRGAVREYRPVLKMKYKYEPYKRLRSQLWSTLLSQYDTNDDDKMDVVELAQFLDTLGSTLDDTTVENFFEAYDLNPWVGEKLTFDQCIDQFENFLEQKHKKNLYYHEDSSSSSTVVGEQDLEEEIISIEQCPLCDRGRLSHKHDIDIITHIALCGSKDWSSVGKVLKPSFATPNSATRRWYSKLLIKLTYGKLALGSDNANILVQDRDTGIVIEEKMSVYVRLGIRLLYRSFDTKASRWKEVRRLLKNLSIKQGIKYDDPHSVNQISSFIKFHNLDMSQCLMAADEFKTFNEFFYRKLKPGARPLEGENNPGIVTSCADCRFCAFDTITSATSVWVKGRDFTIKKLFGGHYQDLVGSYENGSMCVFRLAPQDYHRFHCPVDGIVGEAKYIEGEYFTVNPMAIRSDLDVYGENVRVLLPIYSDKFGTVMMVCVGAMLVGSTIITAEKDQYVKRGEELGYFKFGGSTVLLLFQSDQVVFDSDLTENSKKAVESLIRVGMSIGHSPDTVENNREHRNFEEQSEEAQMKIIRTITGGEGVYRGIRPNIAELAEVPNWEAQQLDIDDSIDFSIDLNR